MVRVVSCDFWYTLMDRGDVHQSRAWRTRESIGVLREYGYHVEPDDFDRALAQVQQTVEEQHWQGTHIPVREQVQSIMRQLGVDNDELVNYLLVPYCYAALRAMPKPLPGVIEALEKLRQSRKILVVTSNTGATPGTVIRQLLEYHGLADYFQAMFFSDELGFSKPHPKVFSTVAERFSVSPQEIVHIGDTWKTDIMGSQQAGWKPVWLHSTGTGNGIPVVSDWTTVPALITALEG